MNRDHLAHIVTTPAAPLAREDVQSCGAFSRASRRQAEKVWFVLMLILSLLCSTFGVTAVTAMNVARNTAHVDDMRERLRVFEQTCRSQSGRPASFLRRYPD